MDGIGHTCLSSPAGVALCDNCQTQLSDASLDSIMSQPQAVGTAILAEVSAVNQQLAQQQGFHDELEHACNGVSRKCMWCILKGAKERQGHSFQYCESFERVYGDVQKKYKQWKGNIKFPGYSCCYTCWLPSTLQFHHSSNLKAKSCKYMDLIPPFHFVVHVMEPSRKYYTNFANLTLETEDTFQEWLGVMDNGFTMAQSSFVALAKELGVYQ